MKKKQEFRLFTIVDFEKEAAYLREMHQKSWKFTGYRYGFFHFEACQPQDVVYGIDFIDRSKTEEDYFQLFADYGWEYVASCMYFIYFRKAADQLDAAGEELLYSDKQSRWEMCKRIFKRRMLVAVLGLFLLIRSVSTRSLNFSNVPHTILSLVICSLLVILLYLLVYTSIGFYRLQKTYAK